MKNEYFPGKTLSSHLSTKRRHRYRLLALGCTLAMLLALCGCGATTAEAPPQGGMTIPEEELGEKPEDSNDQHSPAIVEGDLAEEKTYTQAPEGAQQPTDHTTSTSNVGLIIMTVKLSPPSSYKLSAYNPNTGEIKEIATFEVDTMGLNGEYAYVPAFELPPSRFWFGDDYTKMGVTIVSLVGAGNHAGLLGSDGTLVDITDRLGLAPKSDFADPVIHYMRGLTDEYLWFDDHTALSMQDPTYYVPLSNLSGDQVLEGCPLTTVGDILGTDDDFTPVLPLGDSRYVASPARQNNSFIIESDGSQRPVVDTSRLIWNAVPSPDGTQIAFMSQVKNNLSSAGIYIVPTDGEEPQQIELDDLKIAGRNETYGVADGYSILIDWR